MTKRRFRTFVAQDVISAPAWEADRVFRYKIGDAFVLLPSSEVQEMLAVLTSKIEESVSAAEKKLSSIRGEMEQLKVELYAKFGKSINLES